MLPGMVQKSREGLYTLALRVILAPEGNRHFTNALGKIEAPVLLNDVEKKQKKVNPERK